MHYQGDLGGQGPLWGYVEGGMGQDLLRHRPGRPRPRGQLATGVPVAEILPGEVRLEGGELIRSATVISNADPKRTLGLVDPTAAVPGDFRARVDGWQIRSPVVKLNAALDRLPTFPAAAGSGVEAHRAMVDVTRGLDAAQAAFEDAERGVPNIGFCEVYFQTAYDPSVAPPGRHLVSVFAQCALHLASGDWTAAGRDRPADPGRHGRVRSRPARLRGRLRGPGGPPDIERRIGLTGGHIFQGETMPDQMWEHRLTARTPVAGLYLVRGRHPPGRLGDRPQRPQRRHGRARRHDRLGRPAADSDSGRPVGRAAFSAPAVRPSTSSRSVRKKSTMIGTVRITEPAIRVVLATSTEPASWDRPRTPSSSRGSRAGTAARTGTRSRRS